MYVYILFRFIEPLTSPPPLFLYKGCWGLEGALKFCRKPENEIFDLEENRIKNFFEKGKLRMSRKEDLNRITKNINEDVLLLLDPLIKEVIFLENQLNYLKELPFIVVNPKNSSQQKATIAYKQYKDLSQTYLNAIKVINSALGVDNTSNDGIVIEWLKKRAKKNG